MFGWLGANEACSATPCRSRRPAHNAGTLPLGARPGWWPKCMEAALLNEHCALLADALAASDVVRAAASATAIAHAIDTFGLVCDVGFRWHNPPDDILLLAEQARFKGSPSQSSAVPGGASSPLAEFLANGLSQHGVSADEVAALLQRYWNG